ncbi:MAG TPA: carboxypeptidase-like regulatory domain-containing protein [Gemmatimonadaceae bacterium]|nr:carboxypeptidase-like regulatory domain-containing protein [Gemmatimonadaceae bacterium]
MTDRSTAWRLRAVTAGAIGLLLVAPVNAQQVRGVVVDSLSRRPIGGATVALLSGRDSVVGRTRTAPSGRFVVDVDSARRGFRLRVLALGFTPRVIALGATVDAIEIEIELGPLPSRLDTVRVGAEAGCRPGDNAPEAVRLWSVRRDELLAAAARTDADSAARAIVTNARWYYDYLVDTLPGITELAAFQLACSSLDTFVRAAASDTAADDLLFGDAFLVQHCLRLIAGRGTHLGETGVEFEPTRGGAPHLAATGRWWASDIGSQFRE